MHPPKITTFDVPGMVNVDTKGIARPVDTYLETPFGLYMSRAVVGRHTVNWVESWLLPELGICVSDWRWNPGHELDQDFYLDICTITREGAGRYRLVDHYLDIVVRQHRAADVIDVDEFAEAVAEGLVDADTARTALADTFRAVDGIAGHGHDLDAWLATRGITLSWLPRPAASTG